MIGATVAKTRVTTYVAWGTMLLVSTLPNALLYEVTGSAPAWLLWAKLGLLAALVAASLLWRALRPLRNFALILITIYLGEAVIGRVGSSPLWLRWFGPQTAPFSRSMLSTQLQRLLVSLLIIGALLALGYRRKDFFLTPGRLNAPIKPVRWLGFPKADPWTRFGGQLSIYIALGLLVFLVLAARPSWAALARALPLLPFVLLFATLNAFNEEMTYRASLLCVLEPAVGSTPALWNAALFFGIGHYFGVPYGVVGVAMATFLGWILGKAMLETRGFFWAWFIHFVQDVLIFSFMAIGSITPGG